VLKAIAHWRANKDAQAPAFVQDDAQARTFVKDRATNDPEPDVRAALLTTLAEQRAYDAQTLTFLQDRATNDQTAEVRASALRAIAWRWG
jgi:hypothetical protein